MIFVRLQIVSLLCALVAHAGVEVIPTNGRNVYRLATVEFGGVGGGQAFVGSTYDNRVCAFSNKGNVLWEVTLDGFVFDLTAGDLNGDGRDEVVAAGADGKVSVLSSTGDRLWSGDLQAPVYQVTIAKLDGKTPMVLAGGISREIVVFAADGTRVASRGTRSFIRVLRSGDFNGDGVDEVAVMTLMGQIESTQFYKGPLLDPLDDRIPSRPSVAKGPGTRRKPANGIVADLDGDGRQELIYPPGIFTLAGGVRKIRDLPERFGEVSYDAFYNMRLMAAGDLTKHPGKELVIVEGPEVRIYSSSGKEIGRATASFGFTDVIYQPGTPHGTVLLGSIPNGDDNVYRLKFTSGWESALRRLERHGLMAGIGADLQAIARVAPEWRGDPMIGADAPFDITVGECLVNDLDPAKLDSWIDEVRVYERRFRYPRLRFSTVIWPGEKAPLIRPDGRPWPREPRLSYRLTRDQIIAIARYFERRQCHFWVQLGHGCAPYMELKTVAQLLDAAPRMLLGFVSAEDEQPDSMDYYFEHYIHPILEICLQRGKRMILQNKNVWWAYWPSEANMRQRIFNGRYRSVILPAVEDSNSRTADVNLASRIGLWLDGQVENWASRASADWFSFNRSWEWEYVMTGHPVLRYYLSHALLGARTFMLRSGEWDLKQHRWTGIGEEGTVPFLHLLGTGAITPPRPDQLRMISSVSLQINNPSVRFRDHGANGHGDDRWNRDGTDIRSWAFDRLDTYWGMAPLPATDVSTYLWGRVRRDASQLPVTTPFGFVTLLPGGSMQEPALGKIAWTTDGDRLSKGGRNVSLPEARREILFDLAEAEKQLPVQIDGRAFHQVIVQSPKHLIIAIEDAGWLDPADQTLRLTLRAPGNWQLVDRLTGEALGAWQPVLQVRLPAGTFRLLDAIRTD